MGSRGTEIDGQPTADSAPEDVAVLYAWANLQGAKYRDYSASRREYRAQVRYRAARALLERELKAQVEATAAASEAERRVIAARAMAHSQGADGDGVEMWPVPGAEEAARQAAAERVEAARRTESAARAAVLALREEREIAEAHSSAKRQAQIYEESELRRRELAGPQPHGPLGEGYGDETADQGDLRGDGPTNLQQFLLSDWHDSRAEEAPLRFEPLPGMAKQGSSGAPGVQDEQNAPAWLFSSQSAPRPQGIPSISQTFRGDATGGDTLQDSRERVAARWFALKDIFDRAGPELPAMQPLRPRDEQRPLLAVFSLAGGVGKTSLVAALGRALASAGEKVAVVDTTSQGLLPIYFGSDGRRAEAASPPKQKADLPISLAIHDFAGRADDDRQREILTEEVLRSGEGNHRLLIDLATASSWLLRRLVDFHPTVLVPMAPDMNSVISLQATERLFRGIVDAEGRTLLPFYVLNQFDASLPLHLDVREVFRHQLGDRLLRFAIRRSPSVSEALADGMTVLDYASDAPVSQDYRDLAFWLRSISPPATEESRGMLWGEG
jgi:cellulose biosynthesis protein BcsQ